ncbi:glycosyltransferase [Frigoribacterium sp. VKM Ac-2530]|nr:glycosyltransferase [Frigoribacterium sp. VKM Ac-2530]MBF4578830.1 glycosyltransferase [Frigoribacterium sp. VKM Ac-2530]
MSYAAHQISVVVPVYQGSSTLSGVLDEIAPLFVEQRSRDGHAYVVAEVVLVFDNGPDGSDVVMRGLAAAHPQVRLVWLSRNYGQHAATLAGMASSGGEWVVTLDEDGQHDPRFIPDMLDTAMREQAALVYSRAVNTAPHGFARNLASRASKRIISGVSSDPNVTVYQSYRLVLGDVARAVSAYAGTGVYLDVALGWITARVAQCDVVLREEGGRASGYSPRKLLSHFWRMFLTSGTKGLRLVSVVGALLAAVGAVFAVFVLIARLFDLIVEPGWASLMIVLLVASGAVLFFLGIVAEYIGVAVNSAMGRPAYVILGDVAAGPLGRPAAHARATADA